MFGTGLYSWFCIAGASRHHSTTRQASDRAEHFHGQCSVRPLEFGVLFDWVRGQRLGGPTALRQSAGFHVRTSLRGRRSFWARLCQLPPFTRLRGKRLVHMEAMVPKGKQGVRAIQLGDVTQIVERWYAFDVNALSIRRSNVETR